MASDEYFKAYADKLPANRFGWTGPEDQKVSMHSGVVSDVAKTIARQEIVAGIEGNDSTAADRVNAVLAANPGLEDAILEADRQAFQQQTDLLS